MKPSRPKRTRQRAAAKQLLPKLSREAIEVLEDRIGHHFADRDLLSRAMTHPSALSGQNGALKSNQRLEFLGDRVLGLVIAERLFDRRRTEREGDLAPRLNRLINKRACADAARHMDLGPHVMMSDHEISNGGRARESTLGDVCEAVIAAVYLDGGLKTARVFIERAFAPQFEESHARIKDPKTLLQEWAQSQGHDLPDYTVTERSGPDHDPRFTVEVHVGRTFRETGSGRSKQDGERAAAFKLLEQVDPLDDV